MLCELRLEGFMRTNQLTMMQRSSMILALGFIIPIYSPLPAWRNPQGPKVWF